MSKKTDTKIHLQALKKPVLTVLLILTAFGLGYLTNTVVRKSNIISDPTKPTTKMKKVTGIGGIFFKCKDPEKMNEWYKSHLGLNTNPYGAGFEWRESEDPSKKGFTQWSTFPETTHYFMPSGKDFMINYRVGNLEKLVEELKKEGITILDTMETYDYGKFIHIMDPEGNKIELWEPSGS
jgi:predicted enzyme related to lactoylglutathione lyase